MGVAQMEKSEQAMVEDAQSNMESELFTHVPL
jgi:hypothetical protein